MEGIIALTVRACQRPPQVCILRPGAAADLPVPAEHVHCTADVVELYMSCGCGLYCIYVEGYIVCIYLEGYYVIMLIW
jgi:hypothetical protein